MSKHSCETCEQKIPPNCHKTKGGMLLFERIFRHLFASNIRSRITRVRRGPVCGRKGPPGKIIFKSFEYDISRANPGLLLETEGTKYAFGQGKCLVWANSNFDNNNNREGKQDVSTVSPSGRAPPQLLILFAMKQNLRHSDDDVFDFGGS